jgi:hypothetical protein
MAPIGKQRDMDGGPPMDEAKAPEPRAAYLRALTSHGLQSSLAADRATHQLDSLGEPNIVHAPLHRRLGLSASTALRDRSQCRRMAGGGAVTISLPSSSRILPCGMVLRPQDARASSTRRRRPRRPRLCDMRPEGRRSGHHRRPGGFGRCRAGLAGGKRQDLAQTWAGGQPGPAPPVLSACPGRDRRKDW